VLRLGRAATIALVALTQIAGSALPSVAQSPVPLVTGIDSDGLNRFLSEHAPRFVVALDSSLLDPGVKALVHTGILQQAGSEEPEGDSRFRLRLTEKGQRVAADHGWEISEGVLTIPVGRLDVIEGEVRTDATDPHRTFISTQLHFQANFNVAYLVRIAQPKTWQLISLPDVCLTLADAGKALTEEIRAFRDNNKGWTPLPGRVESGCAYGL
jgi:hypothetical protein